MNRTQLKKYLRTPGTTAEETAKKQKIYDGIVKRFVKKGGKLTKPEVNKATGGMLKKKKKKYSSPPAYCFTSKLKDNITKKRKKICVPK